MNLNYFWINKIEIAEQNLDIGFDLYCVAHLTWLAVIFLVGFLISNYYINLDGRGSVLIRSNAVISPGNAYLGKIRQRNMLKVFAVVLVVFEVIKDIILAVTGFWDAEYLPFHLCGLALFAVLIDAFCEKQEITGQLICYAFMPGAASALIFCNWTEYPFMSYMNMHSFIYHGWIVFYMMMRYRNGEIRPTYKGMWTTFCMVLLLVPPLFTFNLKHGTNFLFLNEASEGSPLMPIWNLLGIKYGYPGYFAGCALLVIVVFHGLYLVYRLGDRRMKHRF